MNRGVLNFLLPEDLHNVSETVSKTNYETMTRFLRINIGHCNCLIGPGQFLSTVHVIYRRALMRHREPLVSLVKREVIH